MTKTNNTSTNGLVDSKYDDTVVPTVIVITINIVHKIWILYRKILFLIFSVCSVSISLVSVFCIYVMLFHQVIWENHFHKWHNSWISWRSNIQSVPKFNTFSISFIHFIHVLMDLNLKLCTSQMLNYVLYKCSSFHWRENSSLIFLLLIFHC